MPKSIVLNSEDINRRLEKLDVMEAMRRLFDNLGNGRAVQPPQTITDLPENRGDFITYLGAFSEPNIFGAKLSPYIIREPTPLISAWTVLMSGETGEPLLLCDSLALTTERTAATTALAVDLIAPKRASRLALIGAGKVGQAHLRYTLPLRDWETVSAWSPGVRSREKELHELNNEIEIADSLEAAVTGADVVMLCTSSATALFNPVLYPEVSLTTSISTNAPKAHEIPPAALPKLHVYCDHRDAAPRSAGEMLIARENEIWNVSDLKGDLSDLATGKVQPLRDKQSYFRSVGLGCEDIAVASALLNLE